MIQIDYDKIKVGDIVEINTNATIGDFTKNHWNGCKNDTFDFFREYVNEKLTFTVTKAVDNQYLMVDDIGPININILRKLKWTK